MKKRPIKNYLKFGIYLFGIFIVIFSCQKETIDDFKETAKEKKLKRISLSTLNDRHSKSSDFIKLSSMFDINKPKVIDFQQRLEASDNPYLLTDEIVMIEKEGATFYTFRVGTQNESDNFYNLVVVFDDMGNILSTTVLEYIPDQTWLNDTTQPFVGEVKSQENDFFSIDDINNLFSARGSSQCITGVSGGWECNFGNDHAPGEGTSCTSWDYIVTVQYGACPPELTQGDDSGYPVDTNPGGSGGGGGGSGGTASTNDDCVPAIDNPCDEDETAILIPRDNDEEEEDDDDCNTSKDDLKKVFSNISDADATTLASVINDKGKDFGIDSKEKLQHFLSQAGHEVGGFNNGFGVEESTNYSTKARLLKIFGKYYSETDTINKRKPDTYVSNSSGHANYVYCCRMGNGDEASGDGYKYRGRGIFQLTGKTNYTNFKTWYNNKYDPDKDFVTNPEFLKDNDTIAILSALWYYKTSVLDKITIDSTTTVKKVTKKVNGGANGLSDRQEIFTKAKDSIDCN
jgi:predicted chitinase